MGLTWWPSSKTPRFQCRRHRFDPGRRSKIPYMPHGVHPSPTTKKSIDEFLRKVIMPSCSVQSLSHVRHFATPWTAARQASLFITKSRSLFKLMSIASVMPYNHLILCHHLLLMPSIFPSIRSFPKSWLFASAGQSIGTSASTSVLPKNIQGQFPEQGFYVCSVAQSCQTFYGPMEFSRQEYWSGLLCPPPGDLPNPGIEPASSALAGGFSTTSAA